MTASLLFSQAPYQTQPPDIERGMIGGSGQNRSAVSKTYDESSGDSCENFLNTLEQIAKDNTPNKQTQGAGGGKSSTSPAYNSGDKLHTTSHPEPRLETRISETTKQLVEDLDNVESQITPDLNLAAVISILEKLGLYDSAGGSSSANRVDEILGNAKGLAALKTRIVRLGQNDLGPSAEMKTVLDRLQQFIANAQRGNALSHNDGDPLGELTGSRSTELADLNQSAENLQAASRSVIRGQTDSIKSAVEARPVGVEVSENAKEQRPLEKVRTDASGVKDGSDTPAKAGVSGQTDSIKSAVEARPVGVEVSENAKEQKPLEKVRTDASGLKDGSDTPAKAGVSGQTGLFNGISSTIDSGKQFGGKSAQQDLPNNDSSKEISREQQSAGDTARDNTVNNESSPVSKMIHDSQLAKENHVRMNVAMSDELGGKITKMDVGANDNGQLGSQNQTAEKVFEAISSSRETEASTLRTQTLDQIVRKAVIHVRNGQHEAKIDLKPEFLGHVRMQVTTENHQVTVKILTEFGFVKDMVENNIHQLKADLQQQGLNVDKLEVAVSSDSDEYKSPHEKAGQAKDRQRSNAHMNPGNREGETREQAGNHGLRKAGTTTVDYFA